ncbi:meiotic recombination protein REC8 homolog [Lampris incognitus]|uniref:meiotic recombination protein REC8 homolog n=1 Tax=Lampris incognitus TaxID=2546036 RepID=UPI0024B4B4FA|nr:meiotic recombination protein REC8 homolog [Lampris incognitus]
MFYYPTVLKRHTGCFSTIWLAATKGIKITRRDYLKVNVTRTCDDIMEYVLVRVPSPWPGQPRPRFSLYLSSQLQYGVIIVYHHQCVILLEETQSILDRLSKFRNTEINMESQEGKVLTIPDALSRLEETERALDPFFGVMDFSEPISSPSRLIQMGQEYIRGESPEHPVVAVPREDIMTIFSKAITLTDREPDTIPTAEFEGVDLADHDMDMVDFLLAQSDQFADGILPLLPTTPSSEEIMMLPQEAPILPPRERPPTEEVTLESVSLPSHISPIEDQERPTKRPRATSTDVPVPEEMRRRRRRRRQLTFFDPETQISADQLQKQISNPLIETKQPVCSLLPSHWMPPAASLLNEPCVSLPEELQLLWRRATTITPLSGSDLQVGERGPESTESEERESAEEVAGPEVQVSRELEESVLPLLDTSETVLEMEMEEEMPEHDIDVDLLNMVKRTMPEEEAVVLFSSLLPPQADRRTVTNTFWKLLESIEARKLCVKQDEPYGNIWISPGSRYEETVSDHGTSS